MELYGAISNKDGKILTNDHFGDAEIYVIFKIADDKIEIDKQITNTTEPEEDEEHEHHHGDPKKAQSIGQLMKKNNIQILVGKAFGPNIKRMIKNFSIIVVNTNEIEETLNLLTNNLDKIKENWQAGENRTHLILRK